eukprot:CFRG3217T1
MAAVMLKPLSLTLVEYPQGDEVGKIMAFFSLAPLVLIPCCITTFFLRRDIFTAHFGVGMVINEILNLAIKNLLKEARPVFDDYPAHSGVYGKFGMPSDHTQFVAYFSIFIGLCLWKRFQYSAMYALIWRSLGTLVLFTLVFGVGFSRIYLRYHTLNQVVAGGIIGLMVGTMWFYIGHLMLRDSFKYVVSLSISKFFLLRDSSDVENVFMFEYEHYDIHAQKINSASKTHVYRTKVS